MQCSRLRHPSSCYCPVIAYDKHQHPRDHGSVPGLGHVHSGRASDGPSAEERHKAGGEAAAELAQQFGFRTHRTASGDSLLYRLLKPLDHVPQRLYPLVVCLSGSGGRGMDNVQQIRGCWAAQILPTEANRTAYPSFLLVPQCPPETNWRVSEGVGGRVLGLIDQVLREFAIDPARVYLTGQSMGGRGTWGSDGCAAQRLCRRHSSVWEGLARPGGYTLAHVPVWFFQGAKDTGYRVANSGAMIKTLQEVGSAPKYTEFPEAGHVVWPLAFDTPELLDRLFAQQRSPPNGDRE